MKKLETVTLESERLILRKCMESDYKDSFKYCCSDPDLCRLQGFDVHKSDETKRRSFKEKEERYKVDNMFYEWAIERKEDNQFMGEIALVQYYLIANRKKDAFKKWVKVIRINPLVITTNIKELIRILVYRCAK